MSHTHGGGHGGGGKKAPVVADAAAATAILTTLGYTNITDVIQHGKTWHALAVPPGGTATVEVSIDPKGRVHYDTDPDVTPTGP